MTTPIYARKDPDNTVNVLDGKFQGEKFALMVTDPAAADLLEAIKTNTDPNTQGSGYAYIFDWTGGKLTTIQRMRDAETQTLTFTYHPTGELATASDWE